MEPDHEKFGARIRRLRKAKGLNLKALSESAGISLSLLSEVETGKANPSIDTLYSIAEALGVPIGRFFASGALVHEPYLREDLSPTIELNGGIDWTRLTPSPEDGVEFLEIRYQPGATSGDSMLRHPGREWIYVLEGSFALELESARHLLAPGDSIVFDSETPHRFSNVGDREGRAVQVNFRAPFVGGVRG